MNTFGGSIALTCDVLGVLVSFKFEKPDEIADQRVCMMSEDREISEILFVIVVFCFV